MNPSRYLKAIVAALLGTESVLETYPNLHWQQAVAAGIGAFLVFMVPNAPKGNQPPTSGANQ